MAKWVNAAGCWPVRSDRLLVVRFHPPQPPKETIYMIKEVPQCKHHKKKKLKQNEFWTPNPFEMYKKTDDSDSKEEVEYDEVDIHHRTGSTKS